MLTNYNIRFREFGCNLAFLTVDFMVVFRAIDESPDRLFCDDVVFTVNGQSYYSFDTSCSVHEEFGFIRAILPLEKTGPICDLDFDWKIVGQYHVVKNGVKTLSSKFSHCGHYSPH